MPKSQYFVHSFCATEVPEEIVLFRSIYGTKEPFTAAVLSDNIAGFQFHPELSGILGVRLLGSICRLLLDSKNH